MPNSSDETSRRRTWADASLHLLHAAIHCARVIGAKAAAESKIFAAYEALPTGGLFPLTSLLGGHAILARAKLIETRGEVCHPAQELPELAGLPDDVAVELLLQRLLTTERPLWLFRTVETGEVPWEVVAEPTARLLIELYPSDEQREAILVALARKVDEQRLRELGVAGEQLVVEACRAHLQGRGRYDLAARVHQVSLIDDTLGFDITAPDCAGVRHRLEVKATAALPGRVQFYLSRNEARVGLGDRNWSLVVVRRTFDLSLEIAGWTTAAPLHPALPDDKPGATAELHGEWASARLAVADNVLTPGLPLDLPRPA
jgi:Domain of unknown function (DUF3883)